MEAFRLSIILLVQPSTGRTGRFERDDRMDNVSRWRAALAQIEAVEEAAEAYARYQKAMARLEKAPPGSLNQPGPRATAIRRGAGCSPARSTT